MARKQDWEREVRDAVRTEQWSLSAPNRIVKTVPVELPALNGVKGYVTVERSIIGRTPRQIEDDLGLPSGCSARGCRVYGLTRLPRTHEVEYELTAEHPDGLAFDEWAALDEVLRRRLDSSRPKRPIYGPGRKSIHQWRLTAEIPAVVLIELLPNVAYAYP